MEKKIVKKLLSILMIITILITDFYVLGTSLITYSLQEINSETNNSNIQFSTYFRDENGKKVENVEKSIKTEDLKLYAEIKVLKEGFFKGSIEILNSNFNINGNAVKGNLENKIEKIEGNKVYLNQINNGESVEIEINVVPIISDYIVADFLSKISTVKLTGVYIYSEAEDGQSIYAEKKVNVDFKADENATPELQGNIITNKIFAVNGENKRVVQVLLKSRLGENQYPIKQTTLKLNIPNLSELPPEKVNVLATDIAGVENWKNENGIVEIVINNQIDSTNQIKWNNNYYDEMIVTFIYAETVDASNIQTTATSQIELYDSKNTVIDLVEPITINITEEINNVIFTKSKINTTEIYKGQLYANITAENKKDIEYETTTTLVITNKDITQQIEIEEGSDSLGISEEQELATNTKYVSTEINKNKMIEILGQDGSITINNGKNSIVINKDTEADANGNIIINYEDSANEINILTDKLEKTGLLELKHKKLITNNNYTREQIKSIKTLNTKSSVVVQNVVENSTETETELKETITKANLTINKENLTTIMKNTGVVIGLELITDGVQYDLYKNSTINVQLPMDVESVDYKAELINDDNNEFEVVANYNSSNKTIEINLNGEQKDYPLEQLYLQLELDITLSKLATTKTDKIVVTYTNKNASQYFGETVENGIIEKNIGISSPKGLVTMFNLNSNPDVSFENNIEQNITNVDAGKELNFETILVNNTDSDISDAKILGKLPTTGVEQNTIETILQSITAQKGTIYFTENSNADTDTEKSENGWTSDLTQLTSAKLYLIKLDNLAIGENYIANIKVKVPKTLKPKTDSYTYYEVIYNTSTGVNTETSRKIRLLTNVKSNVDVNLTGLVGQDTLNTGDSVKEGEVVKYIAKVTNNTNKTLENIEIKAIVPEGTVLVKPLQDYVYASNKYYEEKPEIKEISKNIESLEANKSYIMEYEVRINKGIAVGTKITNKAIVIHNNIETESFELTNTLELANIRVTTKRTNDESLQLVPGGLANYDIIIENISDQILQNVELEIITDDMIVKSISRGEEKLIGDNLPQKYIIKEIPANGIVCIDIEMIINKDAKISVISANVKNLNVTYRSNTVTENLPQIDATISLSSPQNNAYVKEGDILEYNIEVQNVGEIAGDVTIEDIISDYVIPQEVYINGELSQKETEEQKIYTPVTSLVNLNPQQKATIKIIAKAGIIPENENAKVIKNYAVVKINGIQQEVSQEVKHIIQKSGVEEIKNIVSGTIWIDENQNGQRNNEETRLQNVIIKLYDVNGSRYLVDENDNTITTITDYNGEYTFTNVPNGAYIVIFEHDTDTYAPTTYLAEGINSKARIQNILINGNMLTKTGTDIINVNDNIFEIDLGLRNKTESLKDETKKSISGYVWVDSDKDGQKDIEETVLNGVKVKLLDNNRNVIETDTDIRGQYYFANLEKGIYNVVFEYNTEKYEPTIYLAEGVDNNINSKATINKIVVDGEEKIITSTDNIEVIEDIININLGLKEIIIDEPVIEPENPENPDDPEGPSDSGKPEKPGDSNQPVQPESPNDGKEPEKPEEQDKPKETKLITGFAWFDENVNGQKDVNEKLLSGIKVKLYNVTTNNYLTNSDGKIVETTTDENGRYSFNNVEKGSYIVIFEYDTEKYELTKFLAENVDTTVNSKVVLKTININGKDKIASVTDIIKLEENVFNINIGLKENLKFDLELNKYITRVVVQTKKDTKKYDYDNSKFEKLEIHRKQIDGALVVIEYAIKIKNNGEMAGCVQNVVDYLPNGLTFSSELNKDWYMSEGKLYSKSLENVEINPGEEKTVKLILTKTMTGDNIGWINNRAEIYQHYNKYGNIDIDSTPNNQVENEDDMGVADIIVAVSTGESLIGYIILLIINTILIVFAIQLMIKNKVIKISSKKRERR